ncbi:MAG: DUF6992 family protein [Anaerolineae bacterium]
MTEPKTDILQFQAQLSGRLVKWSGFSIASGLILALCGDCTWRGLGSQFAGWGLVDLAIAWFGLQGARKKAATPEAHEPEAQAKQQDNLRRVLWINTGLEVAYVTGGMLLAKNKGKTDSFWRGAGWGIVIQGGFLLLFDLIHALLLEKEVRKEFPLHLPVDR